MFCKFITWIKRLYLGSNMNWKPSIKNSTTLLKEIRIGTPQQQKLASKHLYHRLVKKIPLYKVAIALKKSADNNTLSHDVFQTLLDTIRVESLSIENVQKNFLQLFDTKLISIIQSLESSTRTRVENYLAQRLEKNRDSKPFRIILKSAHDRREAHSEALLKLFQSLALGKFRGEASIDSFFFTIYKSTCLNFRKKKLTLQRQLANPWAGIEEDFFDQIDKQTQKIIGQQLAKIDQKILQLDLEQLKIREAACFELFELHERYGFKYREIAVLKNIQLGALKMRFKNCREKLAKAATLLRLKN